MADKKAPEYSLKDLEKVVAKADADTIARLTAEEQASDKPRAGAEKLFTARLEAIASENASSDTATSDNAAPPAPTTATPADPGDPVGSTFAPPPRRTEQTTPGAGGRPHQERNAAPPAPTTLEEAEAPAADVLASHQRARGVAPAAPAPTRPEELAAAARDAEAVQKGTEELREAANE